MPVNVVTNSHIWGDETTSVLSASESLKAARMLHARLDNTLTRMAEISTDCIIAMELAKTLQTKLDKTMARMVKVEAACKEAVELVKTLSKTFGQDEFLAKIETIVNKAAISIANLPEDDLLKDESL